MTDLPTTVASIQRLSKAGVNDGEEMDQLRKRLLELTPRSWLSGEEPPEPVLAGLREQWRSRDPKLRETLKQLSQKAVKEGRAEPWNLKIYESGKKT